MKKILALFSSLAVAASSASAVLACSTTESTNNVDNAQSQALRNQSVDSLKSYILADQYGMDLVKTKDADTYTETKDFNDPDNNVLKNMNVDGTLGKDNLPLYDWSKTLNSLLNKLGVAPIDIDKYLDQWGGVIKEIPSLINSKNIDSLFQLLPVVIVNTASLITGVPVDPGSIDWLADGLKMNIKYVMEEIDFNAKIKKIITDAPAGQTVNMSYIIKTGLDKLADLGKILFTSYTFKLNGYKTNPLDPYDQSKDNAISAFLGKEILTNVLNKKPIPWDQIKKGLENPLFLGQFTKIVDDVCTFLASVMFQFSVYIPMTMNLSSGIYKAEDASHIFFKLDDEGKPVIDDSGNMISVGTNDEVIKDTESKALTVNGEDILLGDKKTKISLDSVIYGIIDLLSDDDPNEYALQRLNAILFHDDYNADGSLVKGNSYVIDRLSYWLIDALKFTDYTVSIKVGVDADGNKNPEVVAEQKIIGVSTQAGIIMDSTFALPDLFKEGQIELGQVLTRTKKIFSSDWNPWGNFGHIYVNMTKDDSKGTGLLGTCDYIFEPLLKAILSFDNADVEKQFKNIISTITSSSSTLSISFGSLPNWIVSPIMSLASSSIWDKVKGLLTNLLTNLYYTDGTDFFKGLKDLGLPDDDINSLKDSLGPKLPLAKTVKEAVKNTPIGDLTQWSGLVRLDNLQDIMEILFLENPIQDPNDPPLPASDDPSAAKYKRSLIQQILISIDDDYKENRGAKWNYYLGYLTNDEVNNNSSLIKDTHYAIEDGLVGKLVRGFYPDIDDANKVVPDTIATIKSKDFPAPSEKDKQGDDELKVINLDNLEFLDSEVMTKLNSATEELSHDLQGDDIDDIVDDVMSNDDKKIWTTSNVVNRFFNGTDSLRYESYDLTFDMSELTHIDKDGHDVKFGPKKSTYRIIYSRSDDNSKFNYVSITKIS